jgi:hypothetical protein
MANFADAIAAAYEILRQKQTDLMSAQDEDTKAIAKDAYLRSLIDLDKTVCAEISSLDWKTP